MDNEVGQSFALPQLDGRVLSTLNADGSRRWITPREVRGRLWKARFIVAWVLIAIFTALPWMRIAGKPPIVLDVALRQFTFFGTTFRPTETLLLALIMLTLFVGIFLVTALWGRVWCGWACPQTIYLEFVYRPLERLFLGKAYGKKNSAVAGWRRLLMYAVFLILSAHLANTFLAYFVGTDRLIHWTLASPGEHPAAFVVFALTTALMMFDFVFFREQMCTIVCPYGRFQSALLDKNSLIIGYDIARGEPRANSSQRRALDAQQKHAGDCVSCSMCVQVCPTGIDIRDGLQLECVNCTQCIDACNDVMVKVGKPEGLIRYARQNQLVQNKSVGLRYRLLIYPLIMLILVSVVVVLLLRRQPASIEQVRIIGGNFTTAVDGIHTPIRLMIENYAEDARTFAITGTNNVRLEKETTLLVPALDAATIDLTVVCAPDTFGRGSRSGVLFINGPAHFSQSVSISIAGPFNAHNAIGNANKIKKGE